MTDFPPGNNIAALTEAKTQTMILNTRATKNLSSKALCGLFDHEIGHLVRGPAVGHELTKGRYRNHIRMILDEYRAGEYAATRDVRSQVSYLLQSNLLLDATVYEKYYDTFRHRYGSSFNSAVFLELLCEISRYLPILPKSATVMRILVDRINKAGFISGSVRDELLSILQAHQQKSGPRLLMNRIKYSMPRLRLSHAAKAQPRVRHKMLSANRVIR